MTMYERKRQEIEVHNEWSVVLSTGLNVMIDTAYSQGKEVQ